MGVKNSKNYDESPNLVFGNQLSSNGHLTPNDFLAYQQNNRYPMNSSIHMQQQHHHGSLNLGNHPHHNMHLNSLVAPTRLLSINESTKNKNGISTGNVLSNEQDHKLNNNESIKNINAQPFSPGHNLGGNSNRESKKKIMPTKSSLLQELLECPICMNLYENPHVLPCQHTFCKKCLISLQNNDNSNIISNGSIDCPICREKHKLGVNGVDGLAANYTMKRLIELESMTVSEKDKNNISSSSSTSNGKDKAKCFVCQKFSYLQVCNDCSYMLCVDCLQDPNHDIIIESRVFSRKKKQIINKSPPPVPPSRFFSKRQIPEQYPQQYPIPGFQDITHPYTDSFKTYPLEKLKIVLLCHSSSLETLSENENEIYCDEFGQCKTFVKVSISHCDRLITLKKLVENKFGVACKNQIVVYKDKILKNDLKQLSYYQIKQFSRLHIFDSRDIKQNSDDLDADVYGIYQDAESINDRSSIDAQSQFQPQLQPKPQPQSQLQLQPDTQPVLQPQPPPNTKPQPYHFFHQKNPKQDSNINQFFQRRNSFQHRGYYNNYRANFEAAKFLHPKTPPFEKKINEENFSSSSQSFSSVIDDDFKDPGNSCNFFRRNQHYKTISSTMSTNKRPQLQYQYQSYAMKEFDTLKPPEPKLIMGQIKNVRRGSSSANYYSHHKFRLRKLGEIFNEEVLLS